MVVNPFVHTGDHPPDCFPSYVPPSGVWDYDTCFRVYPNCSDPTTAEGNKTFLFYTFTGSWLKAFRQTVLLNASNDFAEFCYFLRTDGNFKVCLWGVGVGGGDRWGRSEVGRGRREVQGRGVGGGKGGSSSVLLYVHRDHKDY